MKVTFFSNFLNHHQLPFCLEMKALLKENFIFVATEEIPSNRLQMNYKNMNDVYDFCLCTYKNKNNYQKAKELGEKSEIVILGHAPFDFIEKRVRENLLTFRYSERIFKNGIWHIFSPRALYNLYSEHTKYRCNNLYMLCASAYTAGDFSMVAAYLNKSFKWGYFPEASKMEANSLLEIKENEYLRILWSGRFLEWKHPEKAIKVARALKNRNIPFKLTMIGDGQQKAKLIDYVLEYQLNDEVDFIGFITPEEVREYMLRSNIFLFTSDYNEGWGAVLNEAMNSGCAVVASHAAGSVPFLIKHEHNGIIYKNSNDKDLIDNIIRLAETPNLCLKYGLAAYRTITETWNAANAAKNFITLSQSLLEGKILSIVEGPGSRANPIKQWDMYKTIVNMSK